MFKSIIQFIKGDYPTVKPKIVCNTLVSKEDITTVDGVIVNCTRHTIGFTRKISIIDTYCILLELFDDVEFMCENVPIICNTLNNFTMNHPWKLCNQTKYMIEDVGLIKPVKVRINNGTE